MSLWNDFASPLLNPLLPVPSASQRHVNESLTAFPSSLTHSFFFFSFLFSLIFFCFIFIFLSFLSFSFFLLFSSFLYRLKTNTRVYLHCDSFQRLHPALWLEQTTHQQRRSRVQASAISALSSYTGKPWHVGTHKTEKWSAKSSSTVSDNYFLL